MCSLSWHSILGLVSRCPESHSLVLQSNDDDMYQYVWSHSSRSCQGNLGRQIQDQLISRANDYQWRQPCHVLRCEWGDWYHGSVRGWEKKSRFGARKGFEALRYQFSGDGPRPNLAETSFLSLKAIAFFLLHWHKKSPSSCQICSEWSLRSVERRSNWILFLSILEQPITTVHHLTIWTRSTRRSGTFS